MSNAYQSLTSSRARVFSADDWPQKFQLLKKKKMKLEIFIDIFGFSMKMHSNEYKQA